jgi:hypothetical protein
MALLPRSARAAADAAASVGILPCVAAPLRALRGETGGLEGRC